MKRFVAILLAVVLLMTCLATVACNKDTVVKVFVHYQDGTNTIIEIYNDRFTLPTPTRDGYTFGGWYLDKDCTSGNEFEVGTPMEENFHVYAKWTKNPEKKSFTVTFVYNDGMTANKQVTVEEGQAVAFPQTPTRDGYTFQGWYETQQGGVQWAQNNPITKDTILYARWQPTKTDGGNTGGNDTPHAHDFGNSYFAYVKCASCDVYGRNESTNYYENVFVYNFNETKKAEIDKCYTDLKNSISKGTDSFNTLLNNFNTYEGYLDYIVEQYQYAYVFYCAYSEGGDSYATDFTFVNNYYNEILANYYGLFALVYNSSYKNTFFEEWDDAEIQEALYLAEAYSENSENKNKADQIATDYNSVMEEMDELYEQYYYGEITEAQYATQLAPLQAKMFDLYSQFVAANNKIAKDAKYDNYMDYAYAVEYGREYKPSEVVAMQNYVRTYVGPIIAKVAAAYYSMMSYDEEEGYYMNFATSESENFYYGMSSDSVFGDTLQTYDEFYEDIGQLLELFYDFTESQLKAYWKATNDGILMANGYLSDYFKYMTSTTVGKKEINFSKHAEELFKNGNYFVGSYEAAYTYYIPAQKLSLLYFGGEDYCNAFTFVHEFGHYYNGIYNGNANLSMDHDETQSQGDEMMLLAWLAQQTASNSKLTSGFNFLELEQLFNLLSTIIMSTAVDEFEQAAYAQSYNGKDLPTITATIDGKQKKVVDYQTLFDTILKTYWADITDYLNTEYWSYVVFDSAAYYISYAMSALPSLEIYVTARQKGLNTARDSYFKLFTCTENETAIDVNKDGECSYQEILNWCGLKGPFQEELYTTLQSYFSSRSLA